MPHNRDALRLVICAAAIWLCAGLGETARARQCESDPWVRQNICQGNPYAPLAAQNGKIVGGVPADPRLWPGYVALSHRVPGNGDGDASKGAYFCGGSLIAPQWVMTAAHCVYPRFGEPENLTSPVRAPIERISARAGAAGFSGEGLFEVVLGRSDLRDVDSRDRIGVSQIIVHPDYLAARKTHEACARDPSVSICPHLVGADIALLKLASPAPASAGLARLSASRQTDPPTRFRTELATAGLGADGRSSDGVRARSRDDVEFVAPTLFLQQVTVGSVPLSQCRRQPLAPGSIVGEAQLCAGNALIPGKDSCNGDSGGPLVAYDNCGCPYLVGMTSWGSRRCGALGASSVYTRVSEHLHWIELVTGRSIHRDRAPAHPLDFAELDRRLDRLEQLTTGLETQAGGAALEVYACRPQQPTSSWNCPQFEVERSGNQILPRIPEGDRFFAIAYTKEAKAESMTVFVLRQSGEIDLLHPNRRLGATPFKNTAWTTDLDRLDQVARYIATWDHKGAQLIAVETSSRPAAPALEGAIADPSKDVARVRDPEAFMEALAASGVTRYGAVTLNVILRR